MPSKIRMERISDRIKELLSELIVQRVSDPRISGAFVTDVNVDRELAFADVFVSAVEGVERSKEILLALDHASGFFRSQLAAQIDLRSFPKLRFHWDPTPEHADHIEQLLASIRAEEKPSEEPEQHE